MEISGRRFSQDRCRKRHKRPGTAGTRPLAQIALVVFARHISPIFPFGVAPERTAIGGCGGERTRAATPFSGKKLTAIRVTIALAHGFGRAIEPSDRQGHDCYWDQHVEAGLVRRPHQRLRLALEDTKRRCWLRGAGPARQGRTKPPASSGRKTGSLDCKVKAI